MIDTTDFINLKELALGCNACSLRAGCSQVVFGEGPAPCNIMFIGEAPGRHEDKISGKPFTGPAGDFFNDLLKIPNLNRESVYVTNVAMCRPPVNKNGKDTKPKKADRDTCVDLWLKKQIELVNPKVIVLLGGVALNTFVPGQSIEEVHGSVFERDGRYYIPLFHPSHILQKPVKTMTNKKDWQTLKVRLQMLKETGKIAGIQRESEELRYVTDTSGFYKMMKHLWESNPIAVDTETDSLDRITPTIVGMSFAADSPQGGVGYFIDHKLISRYSETIRTLLTSKTLIAHNWKYDYQILKRVIGLPRGCNAHDTMIIAHLLGIQPLGLKALSLKLLGREQTHIEELFENKKFSGLVEQYNKTPEIIANYASDDSLSTLKLFNLLWKKMESLPSVRDYYEKIERPLIEVTARIEQAGMAVDLQRVSDVEIKLSGELDKIQQEIISREGPELNIRSPKQLTELFKTKKADKETLLTLAENGNHTAKLILDYRQHDKLKTSYVDTIPEFIHLASHRVHGNLNQTGAITGRYSITKPALQTIPVKTEIGKTIRKLFISPPDYYLLSADYSQLELRVLAHFSQDAGLINAFKEEKDIHSAVCERLFGTVDEYHRKIAKNTVFGCVPMDTEALTSKGWKHYENIEFGDLVLAYNPETKMSEWTPVLEKVYYESAPLIELRHSWFSVRTTPNHRWYSTRRVKPNRRTTLFKDEFVESSKITSEHVLKLSAPSDTPHLLDITPDEAAIIGWVISDGYIRESLPITGNHSQAHGRRVKFEVHIFQKGIKFSKEIKRLLNGNCKEYYKANIDMYDWVINPNWARSIWQRAKIHETGLEQFVINLDPLQRKAFLNACWQAEGDTKGYKEGEVKKLAQNLGEKQRAMELAGYLEGNFVTGSSSLQYTGNIIKRMNLSRSHITGQKIIKTALPSAPVWCIRTKFGTWTMRQNDRIMLTGNTMYGAKAAKIAFTSGIYDQVVKEVVEMTKAEPLDRKKFDIVVKKIAIEKATALLESLYREFPGVRIFQEEMEDFAQRNRWVPSLGGRKIILQEMYNLEIQHRGLRQATNYVIQSSATDIMKAAMILIDKALIKYNAKIINQIHDEVLIEVHKSQVREVAALVQHIMSTAMPISVPLKVDAEIGKDWGSIVDISKATIT